MQKLDRLKLLKFREIIKRLNTDVLTALNNVLDEDWQVTLIKIELNRRNK